MPDANAPKTETKEKKPATKMSAFRKVVGAMKGLTPDNQRAVLKMVGELIE